ncbi:MAG: MBL fold metallo-hydrolase [Parachlamydiales bacterium]|nr:MBL fold metallo-hydrolase [Parachlamydiales bacterium]
MSHSNGQFTLLGTGASAAVPVIGCQCAVCQSSSSYNKRMRTAGLLKINDKNILIDVGPDFHAQAMRFGITNIDGLLITHTHFDHVAGIDEMRIFSIRSKKELPCLCSVATAYELKKRYDYLFRTHGANLTAKLSLQLTGDIRGRTEFLGIPIQYMTYLQGRMQVLGFRFGDFAYITDIFDYPESIFEDLKGVKTLVLSALRYTPCHVHLTVDDAVIFAQKVGAKKTWLTHLSHELDHDKTNSQLPSSVQLGYDGLTIDFQGFKC